jgi:DNA polymerase V
VRENFFLDEKMATVREWLTKYNSGIYRGAQVKLAEEIGVTEGYLSKVLSGESRAGEEVEAKIARALRVPIEIFRPALRSIREERNAAAHGAAVREPVRFYQSAVPEPEPNAQLPVSAVPIRGRVSASGFADLFDDPMPELLAVPFDLPGCYAVQASGNCMEPYLRDGEYAIIDLNRAVLDKKVVLATLDGEYTLKRVRVRGDQVELVPDNPKHASIPVRTNKVVIKGVVIWSCRKF